MGGCIGSESFFFAHSDRHGSINSVAKIQSKRCKATALPRSAPKLEFLRELRCGMAFWSNPKILDCKRISHRLRERLLWQMWVRVYNDVGRKHTWPISAALAYYFLFSLFPALIVLSAAVAYLPGHHLFQQTIDLLARFVPPKSIGIVRSVLKDVITPHKGVYFSVGFVGTIWAASNGVSASIEALNMAYGVDENRPFWKTRLLAIGLVFLIGVLLLTALSVLMVGPEFGQWLAARVDLSHLFVLLWPSIHWIIAVGFTVLGIEALYLLAPNGKRQFRATLPGAAFAVGAWLGLSSLLGVYFRHFQTFDKTYGAIGGVIALLFWLYWTAFAILLGAELNAQLASSDTRRLAEPHETASSSDVDMAA
jgi:membrane protein